jgi:hypothetical protein
LFPWFPSVARRAGGEGNVLDRFADGQMMELVVAENLMNGI